jgi:hypothetical protein
MRPANLVCLALFLLSLNSCCRATTWSDMSRNSLWPNLFDEGKGIRSPVALSRPSHISNVTLRSNDMKQIVYTTMLLISLVSFHVSISAQFRPHDFAGTYSMSHDGWRGMLYLGDGKADCSQPLCMSTYTDSNGRRYPVKVITSGNQITFYVVGLGGQKPLGQKFVGHLMTQTRDAIAGTTWWEGRPFGFYAVKR